ncbi:aspartyl/glutamyl-tRNA amidotransferase subunit A [Candidatus Shapirobacteria bacterium RBG_13_44_7]|uniref:Glutamyl-tRNA(Gln) amidotransferase subunit A n=1 Tax=Candidatus Shapirobacteria bacterium RBG_13_44_7 TaxID=1802149 RepID=A0A1F7SJ36_9BACT|nr:MAG: aspartyl/glutamyl-tRNA amidotransferase subunit A [Candidatus Shapirobacteria bacterium RBG_13_44_7]
MISNLKTLTVQQIKSSLQKKEYTAVELTQAFLAQITKVDPQVKAFITVTDQEALKIAKSVDDKIQKGQKLGQLAGVPLAVKDIYLTQGIETTAASQLLKGYVPQYSSTVYQKVIDEDAVIVGKTNTDPFAFGASTENSGFFTTHNPWNLNMVPGGSSGGSAAAIASSMAVIGLGTDTGGSIRQPSSLCGITGIKVTYGRSSRYGITAMASSFDTPGCMANNVEDVALVTQIMAGVDPNDATAANLEVPQYSQLLNQTSIKNLKIGLPKEYYSGSINQEVKDQVLATAKFFESQGAKLIDISLPYTDLGVDVYYVLVPCEISANMARYDGIRFGQSAKNSKNLLSHYLETRGQFMEPEIKRRILIGTYALSAGYYDAYYLKASKVRTLIREDFQKAYEQVDVILTPVSPTTAWPIGQKVHDPLQMYLADIYTVCVNVAGLPSLALPCGFDSQNLPVGFQLIGNYFEEAKLFSLGHQFQQLTDYHTKKPNL